MLFISCYKDETVLPPPGTQHFIFVAIDILELFRKVAEVAAASVRSTMILIDESVAVVCIQNQQ